MHDGQSEDRVRRALHALAGAPLSLTQDGKVSAHGRYAQRQFDGSVQSLTFVKMRDGTCLAVEQHRANTEAGALICSLPYHDSRCAGADRRILGSDQHP